MSNRRLDFVIAAIFTASLVTIDSDLACAQGSRASSAGARPMGSSPSRLAPNTINRPTVNALPNQNVITRPNTGVIGGSAPGIGTINRPSTLPGNSLPGNIRVPSNTRLPSAGNVGRPTTTYPSPGTLPNIKRPETIINRPNPAIIDRPGRLP